MVDGKKTELHTTNYEPIIHNQKGMSVIEVVLAAAIFAIFASSAVRSLLQNYNANRTGAEYTVATQFASEGLEAVKSIKNKGYANLNAVNANTRGLTTTGNQWGFDVDGTNDTLVHNTTDNYIRTIKVDPVNRDGTPPAGNIAAAGTNDPDTKKITSTVTWNFSAGRSETLSLVTYLSDWIKPIVSGGPTMMAYSKTTSTPFYRTWNGTSWSGEGSAQVVGGNINYIVLKSSRTRNEAILGTLDSNGNIYGQVWNGTSWGSVQLMVNLGAANSTTRSFDIEYEKNSDRAVFVYPAGTGNIDFAYRTWDGTGSWSAASSTITTPPTTAIVRWIDIAQNPLSASNDIAMIMSDNSAGVYGMLWNGTSWGNMGVATTWDTASIATKKVTDVAYEQLSGHPLFIWGDTVATDQYYRTWNGTSLTGNTLLDIPASGGVANWIELVSRPDSDELMYGVLDAGADLNTRKWSGSAWDAAAQHAEHTAGAENVTSMPFDIVWETFSANPGKAWLMFGDGTRVTKKQWSGTAWGAGSVLTGSDDTSFIRLKAVPATGEIFAGIYESATSSTDDIHETNLTGGSTNWSAQSTIWAGPISAEPVHFRIDIAAP